MPGTASPRRVSRWHGFLMRTAKLCTGVYRRNGVGRLAKEGAIELPDEEWFGERSSRNDDVGGPLSARKLSICYGVRVDCDLRQ